MTLVLDPQTDVRADWRKAFPESKALPEGGISPMDSLRI
jgi:hypothetical protein